MLLVAVRLPAYCCWVLSQLSQNVTEQPERWCSCPFASTLSLVVVQELSLVWLPVRMVCTRLPCATLSESSLVHVWWVTVCLPPALSNVRLSSSKMVCP